MPKRVPILSPTPATKPPALPDTPATIPRTHPQRSLQHGGVGSASAMTTTPALTQAAASLVKSAIFPRSSALEA